MCACVLVAAATMVGGGDVDKHAAAAALAQDLPSFNTFFDQTVAASPLPPS